jgi:hypothetical protein
MTPRGIVRAASFLLPLIGIILALQAWSSPLPTHTFMCSAPPHTQPSPCGELSCGSVLTPKHTKPIAAAALAAWDPRTAQFCEEERQDPLRAGVAYLSGGVFAGFVMLLVMREISRRARVTQARAANGDWNI